MTTERLQKILARAGIAARRKAETLILEGRVRVNGRVVDELGAKADPKQDHITVDGRKVIFDRPRYYLLYKPLRMVTTLDDPENRPCVGHVAKRLGNGVFPVGRLDFNTAGALLLTNDGELAQVLAHPSHEVPRVYHVKVRGLVTKAILERWRKGIRLGPVATEPCDVFTLEAEKNYVWLEVELRQGINRQLHRMAEATGLDVVKIKRISFAGLSIEGMKPGDVRELSDREVFKLKRDHLNPAIRQKRKARRSAIDLKGKSGHI